MPRAIWTGHISFGLIHVPVTLYSGERRSEIHFRMLDSRNHARVRYERVNEETSEEVPWNEIVKADALLLILMRYQQELRSPQEFDLPRAEASEHGVSEKGIAMADQLIESMREEWRPERYRDEHRDELMEWIEPNR